MAGWDNYEQAKRWAIERGYSFLVMFGDRPQVVFRSVHEAKSHARYARDEHKIPDVSIKRFRI